MKSAILMFGGKVWLRVDGGVYGDVFKNGEFAIKVFKRLPDIGEGYIGGLWMSQVEAYERANSNGKLKDFVPNFFGAVEISSILCDGVDISSNFYLNFNYQMEFIDAVFGKNNLSADVVELFRGYGIDVKDSSVCCYSGGMRVVDIQMVGFDVPPSLYDPTRTGLEDIL